MFFHPLRRISISNLDRMLENFNPKTTMDVYCVCKENNIYIYIYIYIYPNKQVKMPCLLASTFCVHLFFFDFLFRCVLMRFSLSFSFGVCKDIRENKTKSI